MNGMLNILRIMTSVGKSDKRLITTVLQQQEIQNLYYVVTARDMAKKERVIYRKEKVRKEKNDQ
ncbi:MAG: hypothetical protein COZ34_05205 [Candidatus Pacebacteria bacterium CG_4_10_14_3_um_filter_34_15]|nr:MAG: hypothetical protein AUJ41_03385 [Candidatus Pacebacteria bacterium CG1_02_43_31]PIX81084.1 MAG: hypothetical protein COZ34_05205 [Candidatus Pacebacteria bacterium CG_4_10_14_3_um_filter_34_15]PJC43353.1 MAG: hypothetical protein CO039_04600 [Candidatus Pacebacteria bacterium CG_4_9_14_0_2_um_filter_34_50]